MMTQKFDFGIFTSCIFLLGACASIDSKNCHAVLNDPSLTVFNFIEAENSENYDFAKEFIDLNSVYGEVAEADGITPEEFWKNQVSFQNTSLEPIIIGGFDVSKYEISYSIDSCEKSSQVQFKQREYGGKIIRTYFLSYIDDEWIIKKIYFN